MKKCVIIVSFFVLMYILTSCTLRGQHISEGLFDNSTEAADHKMESIIKALKNRDEKAMRDLFSQKSIDEADHFDESITALFDFYKGDLISYSSDHLPISESEKNNGEVYISIKLNFDVETSEQKYKLAFQAVIEDTAHPENIGICSLYIVQSENFATPSAYWGDGNWTPGIVIDKTTYVFDRMDPESRYNAIDQGQYVFYIYDGTVYCLNCADGETCVLYKAEQGMKGIEPEFYVDEDYVYFSVCSYENTQDICRVCRDGTGFEKLINIFDVALEGEIYHSYLVDKGCIYIQMGWELYRYHIDTGASEKILDNARFYEVYDSSLYFGDGSSIWQMNLTDGSTVCLYSGNEFDAHMPVYKHFNVFEGGICYFTRNPTGLYYCCDGNTKLISGSETVNDFSAFEHNGDIYFVDGEQLMKFSPGTSKTEYVLDCPDYYEGGKIINNKYYYRDDESHYHYAKQNIQ